MRYKFIPPLLALAVIAGLFGAVLGSTHPIAAALVSAFAGALTSASIIAICIATLPHYVFGVGLCNIHKSTTFCCSLSSFIFLLNIVLIFPNSRRKNSTWLLAVAL